MLVSPLQQQILTTEIPLQPKGKHENGKSVGSRQKREIVEERLRKVEVENWVYSIQKMKGRTLAETSTTRSWLSNRWSRTQDSSWSTTESTEEREKGKEVDEVSSQSSPPLDLESRTKSGLHLLT